MPAPRCGCARRILRGWTEAEWRWRRHDFPPRPFAQPLWDGSPLARRTILLHAEQGLGDTLQFIRYVPLVKERGGRVIVECQPALLSLLAGCAGIDRLVARARICLRSIRIPRY